MGLAAEGGELERSRELPRVPRPVFDEGAEPVPTVARPSRSPPNPFGGDGAGIFEPAMREDFDLVTGGGLGARGFWWTAAVVTDILGA